MAWLATQLGTFSTSNLTGVTIKHLQVRAVNTPALFDVTGAGDANSRQFANGIATAEFESVGVVAASTTAFGLAQNCQFNFTGVNVEPLRWTIRKVWPLVDITDSGTSVKRWQVRIPKLSVHIDKAVVTSGGPAAYTDPYVGTSIQIDQLGDISNTEAETAGGTAYVSKFVVSNPFYHGGPVDTDIRLEYGGSVSYDLTNRTGGDRFSWLFNTSGQVSADDFPEASAHISYRVGGEGSATNVEAFINAAAITIDRSEGGRIPIMTHIQVGSFVVPV